MSEAWDEVMAIGAAVEHMHRTRVPVDAAAWVGRLRGLVFRWRELDRGAAPSYRVTP